MHTHRPWQRGAVLALLTASLSAAVVGNALMPLLLRESPVLLLVVLSSYAQMALASVTVDPTTFILVAATRRWAGEVIAFAAGRVLGAQAMDWYTRRSGRAMTLPEGINERWSLVRDAAVVCLPHMVLSAFFGLTGMSPRRFVALKALGSLLTVSLLWYVTRIAGVPLATVAEFVETNAIVLTMLAATAVASWLLWQRRDDATADDGDATPTRPEHPA